MRDHRKLKAFESADQLVYQAIFLLLFLALSLPIPTFGANVFDVKNYGATGKKADDARPAIQKAIDACAAAGGGVVLLPSGDYTAGTLRLRSHVHFRIEAGATLFASPDPKAYDFGKIPSKAALFYGEDLEDISIGGQGTVDGQAEYEWRPDDIERNFEHKILMEKLGKSLMRSFPKDFPKRQIFPHLVWLGRATNVNFSDLKLLHSPNWTMALYACERVSCAGLYIYTSLKEAVWADGIDLDGCKDVLISNCTIATGDDCVVFISENSWGPALNCESITVTNCRLSSASAGIKFSEGTRAEIKNIQVKNTVLTNVNRGIVFCPALGGHISNAVFSDLTIDCNRFDWFWAGDGQPFHFRVARISELNHEAPAPGEPPPGSIRNVQIRNVVARGKGSSVIQGHPESWLEGISFENVKLFISTDPAAPFDKAEHALQFRWAKNLKLKNVEISWGSPQLSIWKSALYLEDVNGLELDGFAGRAAWLEGDFPAVMFNNVSNAIVRNSRALDGTKVFLEVMGQGSRNISLQGNDFRKAKIPCQFGPEVQPAMVKKLD